MKMFKSLLAATIGFAAAGNIQAASVNTNATIVQFKIAGLMQTADSPVITTNSDGSVTTEKFQTTSVKITTQDVLGILETEFDTTFPDGAQLALPFSGPNSGDFEVLDKTGNVLLIATNPADTDYVFSLSNNVVGSEFLVTEKGKAVITEKPSTTNEVVSLSAMEPDTGIFYADGNGNNFHMDGLLSLKLKQTADLTGSKANLAITISGNGGGDFFNSADDDIDTGVFTKATVTAKGNGITGLDVGF